MDQLWFTSGITKDVTIGGAETLTIYGYNDGTGIQVANGVANNVTVNVPIAIGWAQAWTNNSGNPLTIAGLVTLGDINDDYVLTVNGSGNTLISGNITDTAWTGER